MKPGGEEAGVSKPFAGTDEARNEVEAEAADEESASFTIASFSAELERKLADKSKK